ncbi:MAG: pentapeptide repeat-containing protein [Rhodothermales bacterium]
MANPKHLEIFQRGALEWNSWRKGTAEFPDLSHHRLDAKDYSGWDFNYSDLSFIDASGVTFDKCSFLAARLSGANLSHCSIIPTSLVNTNLEHCDLSHAIIVGGNFQDAKFEDTILIKTKFQEGVWASPNQVAGKASTAFIDCDLSRAQYLETCIFEGNVIIDNRTLNRSVDLSTTFLLNAGLSKEEVRSYSHDASITIIFKESSWRDLVPIEHALRIMAIYEKDFDIVRSDDRLILKLQNQNQLNQALETIGALLSALQASNRDQLSSIRVTQRGLPDAVTSNDELAFLLTFLIDLYEQDNHPQALLEVAGKGILESSAIGKLFQGFIDWTHSRLNPDPAREKVQQIYKRCRKLYPELDEFRRLSDSSTDPKKLNR